jgi:GTPase
VKVGVVAIIGRPNVGKSTLLNLLVGEKIAIVSDKPQTTRTRILGVLTHADSQIVFLDTPGLHTPRHLLDRRMVKTAQETMGEADLLFVMVEGTGPPQAADRLVIDRVREHVHKSPKPAFLLINKVDLVNKTRILPLIDEYNRRLTWTEIVPLSAKTLVNIDRLLDLTRKVLREGEALYTEDVLTDQPMRMLAAEIIREKILHETRQEVPHSVAVEIEQFVEEGKLARIAASILVEKQTQKPIIVGKAGQRLKAVGTAARLDMERLFGMKVFLQLWVKVKEGWREDKHVLADLGY